MTTDACDQGKESAPKAKAFISYSGKDIEFADRLDAALRACGFEPLGADISDEHHHRKREYRKVGRFSKFLDMCLQNLPEKKGREKLRRGQWYHPVICNCHLEALNTLKVLRGDPGP